LLSFVPSIASAILKEGRHCCPYLQKITTNIFAMSSSQSSITAEQVLEAIINSIGHLRERGELLIYIN
jgi:hypothetical protein